MEGNSLGFKVRNVSVSTSDKIDSLGRLLYSATGLNLDMHSDGYVRVQDLLKSKLKTRSNFPLSAHSMNEIREAVRINNKQRLGLIEKYGQLWIRANQGHTLKAVESESLLKPILSAEDIPFCIHGTYKRHLESILASGLKRMARLHIHFSHCLPSHGEVISGMRRDVNLLIFIDTEKAMEDGMKFYKSENGVILTEGFDGVIPVKYFQRIETWPRRQLNSRRLLEIVRKKSFVRFYMQHRSVIFSHKMSSMETIMKKDADIGGSIYEIFGVKIEKNPPQSKLDELQVTTWPKWSGEQSKSVWTLESEETIYLLEGRVKISFEGHKGSFEIGGGDLVVFRKGMKITWEVLGAASMHYHLD